jgi:hypothetical protein
MSDDRRDRSRGRAETRIVLLVAALVGSALPGCTPAPPSECVLDGSVAGASVVRRDSPVAQLHNWTTAVFVVRNRDSADWRGVEAAITGVELAGAGGRHATGRYVGRETKHVPRGATVAFDLADFENSRGGRWAALTMQPTAGQLTLRRGGVACRVSVVVAAAIE